MARNDIIGKLRPRVSLREKFTRLGEQPTILDLSYLFKVYSKGQIRERTLFETCNEGLFKAAYGPLTRYVKLRDAHVPGMSGRFPPPTRVSDPDMHHGTCVTHVPWCMPGSLPSGFLWSRWWGKRSQHSRRMRKPQFYVSGKRPVGDYFYSIRFHTRGQVYLNILSEPSWKEA